MNKEQTVAHKEVKDLHLGERCICSLPQAPVDEMHAN